MLIHSYTVSHRNASSPLLLVKYTMHYTYAYAYDVQPMLLPVGTTAAGDLGVCSGERTLDATVTYEDRTIMDHSNSEKKTESI